MTTGLRFNLVLPVILIVTALFACVPPVAGQTIQLSDEQQRLLNQLPPAQRQQALDAIRQMSAGGDGTQPGFSTLNEEPVESEFDPLEPEPDQGLFGPPPTAKTGSTLILHFSRDEDLAATDERALDADPARARLEGSQVFVVDDAGSLDVPGVTTVQVSGLTAEEIRLRLEAEERLRLFEVDVYILEPEVVGSEALQPFGYDVFGADQAGFDPVLSGPVPPDYVLGPGDSIRVQLFGNVNGIYEYEVTRDGVLNLPEIGPVTVAGLPFSEFRADLDRRVREMLIGTQVSATMGQLRTIRVFVLGDVNRPGSYVLGSLATMSSALYSAGGISEIGSLRDVQLKRQGGMVSRLDLYDLLLRGDTSSDVRLQPGDVVFVPPVGAQVAVDGAVKRPAVYEIASGTSITDTIELAGGYTASAYPAETRIDRVDSTSGRIVVTVDAADDPARSMAAQQGDTVFVPEVVPEYRETVDVVGHAYRTGPRQWRSGMRLVDVLPSLSALQPGADNGYLLIRRENAADRRLSVISADLSAAVSNPASDENVAIRPGDRIHVFSLAYGRQRVIEPLLEELELQSRFGMPNPVVSVSGTVRAPGAYPLEPGMRVSDLVRAAGDLAEDAYAVKAELVRYDVVSNEFRTTEIIDVDLAGVLRGSDSADLLLAEHDNLRISMLPDWDTLWTVSLEGEVMFPGEYRIRRGETLSELLTRAGGLSNAAYPEGAVFLRESLRIREQQQIEVLARRLEADLTSISLQASDSGGADTLTTGRELLAQLRSTDAVGRLVIDLASIVSGAGNDQPLELRDNDRLLVPKQPQSVTVIGETQQNTSHIFSRGLSRDDYIARSGGLTRRADRKLIYVVRASGAVEAGARSRWFGRKQAQNLEMRPGDTIVVPLETDRIRPLTLWTNVTQILYQAAIAVAAIDTFGN